MSEEEYDEFITLLREKKGWSYEQMAKDLETGVNNGYSIEFQASLLKAYVKL